MGAFYLDKTFILPISGSFVCNTHADLGALGLAKSCDTHGVFDARTRAWWLAYTRDTGHFRAVRAAGEFSLPLDVIIEARRRSIWVVRESVVVPMAKSLVLVQASFGLAPFRCQRRYREKGRPCLAA
jgi:hypothetical protein